MFSPHENPELFNFFTKKKLGHSNHIRLPEDKMLKFLTQCERLSNTDPENQIAILSAFFKIMSYIEESIDRYRVTDINENIPANVRQILDYINKNYTAIRSVNDIAEECFVSISTMERYFKKYLSMTPRRYLEDKKLQKSCMLLRQGYSVTDACFESGFDDYSHFITVFKKKFGTTPLKYKKGL